VVGASTDTPPARLVNGSIVRQQRPVPHEQTGNVDGANVLDCVFSFLFGDGPPRPESYDRWRTIAAVIRHYDGVVPAEILAPYLDQPPPLPESTGEDDIQKAREAAIAPVVEHFRGKPRAVPNGRGFLVYMFPELLGDAAAQTLGIKGAQDPIPRTLTEGEWVFSRRSFAELGAVATLGAVNLVGALWLHFASMPGRVISRLIGPISAKLLLFLARWLLVPYALLFLAVPGMRLVMQSVSNRGIRSRNAAREAHTAALDASRRDPGSLLREKEQYARVLWTTALKAPSGIAAANVV